MIIGNRNLHHIHIVSQLYLEFYQDINGWKYFLNDVSIMQLVAYKHMNLIPREQYVCNKHYKMCKNPVLFCIIIYRGFCANCI